MYLGGVWYGFAPPLTCNENVPLKHPIPVNKSLYSSCNCHVVFALASMAASLSVSAIK